MIVTSTSPFHDFALTVRTEIDHALGEYLDGLGRGCPPVLQQAMRHSLMAPGKRLRPLLVLMAAEACGQDRKEAIPAACAVEMVHTYSLIHDDLPSMDNDDLRRGLPTCHRKFGEANAILAGDALLALAFQVLATQRQPADVIVRCCAELARASGPEALVGGQADDLAAQPTERSLSYLEAIHARKTGAIFHAALQLGAAVAQASATQERALSHYGRALGLAFQIVDDLLDCRSSTEVLGKSAGKDQQQNKLTFVSVLGEEASRRRAEELIDAACQALQPFDERARPLAALARYVVERDR